MAERWWIGGTGTWSNTAFWSDSPGGSGGFSAPVAGDDVYIDPVAFGYTGSFSISGGAVTCDTFVVVNFMGAPNTINLSGLNVTVRNICAFNGSDITAPSLITMTGAAATSSTIITSSVTLTSLTINAPTKTIQFNSAVTFSSSITLTAGTLSNAGGSYTITCSGLSTSNSNTRSIVFDNGTTPATWIFTGTPLTATTSTNLSTSFTGATKLVATSSGAVTFNSGGKSYPTLVKGTAAGTLTVTGGPTLYGLSNLYSTRKVPTAIAFTSGTTTTITNSFDLLGSSGSLVTITAVTAGTQATLSKSSGTVSADYLSIKDSNATGGATWYAGANSTNVSNNTGWIFTAPPTTTTTGNFLMFFR